RCRQILGYHKFTGRSVVATEYGSSENEKDFAYLVKYSPLHNIRAGTRYPATPVTTAAHDDRVSAGRPPPPPTPLAWSRAPPSSSRRRCSRRRCATSRF